MLYRQGARFRGPLSALFQELPSQSSNWDNRPWSHPETLRGFGLWFSNRVCVLTQNEIPEYFQATSKGFPPLLMQPRPKPGSAHPKPRKSLRPALERVMTACAELTNIVADPDRLRETLAESTRQILQAPLAVVLMSGGTDGHKLAAVSSETQESHE